MTLDKQAHFFAGAAIASVIGLYFDPLARQGFTFPALCSAHGDINLHNLKDRKT